MCFKQPNLTSVPIHNKSKQYSCHSVSRFFEYREAFELSFVSSLHSDLSLYFRFICRHLEMYNDRAAHISYLIYPNKSHHRHPIHDIYRTECITQTPNNVALWIKYFRISYYTDIWAINIQLLFSVFLMSKFKYVLMTSCRQRSRNQIGMPITSFYIRTNPLPKHLKIILA